MGSLPGQAVRIYIVSANGGGPEPMTPGDTPQIDPNWSPDGDSLMFSALPALTEINNGQPDHSDIRLEEPSAFDAAGFDRFDGPPVVSRRAICGGYGALAGANGRTPR